MNPIYLFVSVLLAFTLIPAINGAYIKLSAILLRYQGVSWRQGFRFGLIVFAINAVMRAISSSIFQMPLVLGILLGLIANWLIGSWYFSRQTTNSEEGVLGWHKALKLTGLAVLMLGLTATLLIGVSKTFS